MRRPWRTRPQRGKDRLGAAARLGGGLLVCALLCSCAERPPPPTIPQALLASRMRSETAPRILDVRTLEEYRSGHVPGAVHIPHDELRARVGELGADRSSEIVVYCESGNRASLAEAVLRQEGFTSVRHLEGDMSGWRQSGLPIASD